MQTRGMQTRADLIDRVMESYVDWRRECAELWVAYEHWSSVPFPERPVAFETYLAALDREERACGVYTDLAGHPAGPSTRSPAQ